MTTEPKEPITTTLQNLAEATIDCLRPICQAVLGWAQNMYGVVAPAVRAAYDAAGQPYGPEDADMWRWLVEQGRVEQARREAEWQQEYEEVLAAIRRGE